MKIYFAGSIRGAPANKDTYFAIIQHLKTKGEVLTEHVADKSITPEGEKGLSEKEIHDRDMNWLDQAEVIVEEGTALSWGAGYELGRMTERNAGRPEVFRKPILSLYKPETLARENRMLSAMKLGCQGIKVVPYSTLDDAKRVIDAFFESIPQRRGSDIEDYLL